MSRIEDVLYEAYELGIREKVFTKVEKMKRKEKYRYTELNVLYEKALNKIKNKVLIEEMI